LRRNSTLCTPSSSSLPPRIQFFPWAVLVRFAHSSSFCSVGQTIIREAFVLDRDKSIPRGPFAGLAGGSKYAAAGIFFKYAHDVYGIYGGNEAAAKAAGHEARSHAALASLSHSSLRQPLCIVLDYLGYRLICMALLPISQRSLQYGSADGGRHVLCRHEGIAEAAASVAKSLFLKKHRTGLPSSRTVGAAASTTMRDDLVLRKRGSNRVDKRAADNDGYLSDKLDDNDDDDDDDDDDDRVGYDSLGDEEDGEGSTTSEVRLAPLAVTRDDGTSELHFPGDIECHLGSDQRYYVIDVARLFPPEAPSLFLFGILLDPEANSMTEIELSVRERRRSIVTADVHQRLVVLLGDGYETVQVGDDMQLHHAATGTVNQLATALINHVQNRPQTSAVVVRGLAVALRSERSAHLINLLRPELLQAHQVPLSSDAYSMWGFDEHEVHNAEVLAATRELVTVIAPRLVASWLADATVGETASSATAAATPAAPPSASLLERDLHMPAPADPCTIPVHLPIDGADLVRELHRSGVNVRYIGLVRRLIGSRADERASRLRGLLLIEMISRVCKNYLRTCLREVRSANIVEYHNVIARVFNLVLGVGRDADLFWAVHIRCLLLLKFGRYSSPLQEGERSAAHDLRSQLSKAQLFLRLQEATGVLFRVGYGHDAAVDLAALERYFGRHSGEPPFRASQIVRLAGKTKKLVFAQGGIGIGVAVGLGGTKRGARSLPNHASSAGFASRLDELRARLVCASLPPLAAELLDELFAVGAPVPAIASAVFDANDNDAHPPALSRRTDSRGIPLPPPMPRWVRRQTELFSKQLRKKDGSLKRQRPSGIAPAGTPINSGALPAVVLTQAERILPTAPLPPLPCEIDERLLLERQMLPMSWRVEECATASGVSTLANTAAVLGVARLWASVLLDVTQRGLMAAQTRSTQRREVLAAVLHFVAPLRRRALLWLVRGCAALAHKFDRMLVAGDCAIACTVMISTICEHVVCVDDWLVRHAAGVQAATAEAASACLPQLAAHIAKLLDDDAAFVERECGAMAFAGVEESAVDCVAALNGALRQSIQWLEQLYGGRGRSFGGGHPMLILLWRRLASSLRAAAERDGGERENERRARLTEANDLSGFAAHLARTFSPNTDERQTVARMLTHPNLSITLSKPPSRLLGIVLPARFGPASNGEPHASPRVLLESADDAVSAPPSPTHGTTESVDDEELPLVHTFGHNKDGRLGLGDDADQRAPCVVGSLQGLSVQQVECGDRFTVALCRNGDVYAWGDCSLGHVLGLDANVYRAPVLCSRLQNRRIVRVLSINTFNHRATIAVDDTGGAAVFGQLGSLPADIDELLADGPLRNIAAGGWCLYVDGRVRRGGAKSQQQQQQQQRRSFTASTEEGVTMGGSSSSSSSNSALVSSDGGEPSSPRAALLPHGVDGIAMSAVSASHAVVLGRLRDGSTQVLAQQRGQLLSIMNDERCVDVACGRQFVTMLTQSGVVFEWSHSSTAPLSFAPAMNKVRIERIAAGDWHTAAVSSTGDLFTWGSDKYGQCGHGTNDDAPIASPRRVSALRTRWVFDVSCGSNHTAVVSLVRRRAPEGALVARMRPLQQPPLKHTMRFDTVSKNSVAVSDDAAASRGSSSSSSSNGSDAAPTAAARPLSFAATAARLTLAQSAALQCWMWRVPYRTTHTVNGTTPAVTSSPTAAAAAAAAVSTPGGDDSRLCRITRRSYSSVVRVQNPYHARSTKATQPPSSVRELPGLQRCDFAMPKRMSTMGAARTTIIGIGGVRGWGRMDDSIALVCHGAVLTAGRNADGQLGHGDRLTRATHAEALPSLQGETIVSAAMSSHSAFVTASGRLFTCGRNAEGQCGHGDVTTRLVPRSVVALHQIAVTTVACGVSHSLASTRSGEVWSWGGNAWGQLGHGDRSTRTQPILVRHLHQVVSVAAGHSHSAAVTRNEALFAWGYGRYGALGLGSLRDEFVPRRVQLHVGGPPVDDVPPLSRAERRRSAYGERLTRSTSAMPNYGANVRLLACGPSHTVAVDSENRIWYWGGVVDVGAASPRLAHFAPPTMSESEVAAQLASGSAPLGIQAIDGGFQCAAALTRDAGGFQHAIALLFGGGDLLGVEMLVAHSSDGALCAVDAVAQGGRLYATELDAAAVRRQYVVAFGSGSSQFVALL
jgi:alpha-tubulin suppressor-like RCC1 family protein